MSSIVFSIFKIGIGPSSSHTVGPMLAACSFSEQLLLKYGSSDLEIIKKIDVHLFGSLALTGLGHGTDGALILGLEGQNPEFIDIDTKEKRIEEVKRNGTIKLGGKKEIPFLFKKNLLFHYDQTLPLHPNGMKFVAYDEEDNILLERNYYSVGGGFIKQEELPTFDSPQHSDFNQTDGSTESLLQQQEQEQELVVSFHETHPSINTFHSAKELLDLCHKSGHSISSVILEYEKQFQPVDVIRNKIFQIWNVMKKSIQRGCQKEGILPGGLKVKRRAPGLFQKLSALSEQQVKNDPFLQIDWVNLYALAVNEENASGGKIVTAPTNGAAGIIPAVLNYVLTFTSLPEETTVVKFLLTAAAIGHLYKENASLSGAEVGCQGEVGVACSMAAGALAEVLGGTPEQVENAAEIGMEHNLGLTCDPINGLVQIPCIERNAMASVKAINSARLALRGDGRHWVSLDSVIETMRQTGADMKTQYKETSQGGLAVNWIEC